VVGESVLGHLCCFDASVVDTFIPRRDYADGTQDWSGSVVCECLDVETAQMIAAALNKEAQT